jgi:hypothetical protein
VRGGVLLVDEGHDVVLGAGLVGSGLVGVVGAAIFDALGFVDGIRDGHIVHVVESAVLVVLVLVRVEGGSVLHRFLLVRVLCEFERVGNFVGEAAGEEIVCFFGGRRPAHYILHGLVLSQEVLPVPVLLPEVDFGGLGVDAVSAIGQKLAFWGLGLEGLIGFNFEVVDFEGEFGQMFDVCELGVIALEPHFEVVDDTLDHRQFSLVGVWEVDLDVVFADVGVDPDEHFALTVEEHHVLIYHEVAVVLRQSAAPRNYCPGVVMPPIRTVGLLQTRDRLRLQLIRPHFLHVRLGFPQNDFGGAFHRLLLSLFEQFPLLLGLDRDAVTNFIIGLHQ